MTQQALYTKEQARTYSQQFCALSDWLYVKQYADQVYGIDKAATVEIETYGDSNDEGGTNYSIEGIFAYGDDRQCIHPDTSTPFMKLVMADALEVEDDEDDFKEEIKEFCCYGKKEGDPDYVLWYDLPVDPIDGESGTFNLRTMPIVPVVIVLPTATS